MRKLLTGCYAVLLVLLAAAPAAASDGAPSQSSYSAARAQPAPPRYVSSEPSDGETVHQAPDRVEVTFDQPLDGSSRLSIIDECKRSIHGGKTEVEGNSMSIAVAQKPAGMYHVRYLARGLGGITGENKGHFMFTVHGGDPCGDGGGNHHGGGDKKNEHDGPGDKGGDDGNGHEGGHGGGGGGGGGQDHGPGRHTGSHTQSESGSGHGGTTHAGDGHTSVGHGNGNGKHGAQAHDKHGADQAAGGDVPGITTSDTARKLMTRADSGTLLLSLALCVLLGILGGAILRASGAR